MASPILSRFGPRLRAGAFLRRGLRVVGRYRTMPMVVASVTEGPLGAAGKPQGRVNLMDIEVVGDPAPEPKVRASPARRRLSG